jgi:hypothetical protein
MVKGKRVKVKIQKRNQRAAMLLGMEMSPHIYIHISAVLPRL